LIIREIRPEYASDWLSMRRFHTSISGIASYRHDTLGMLSHYLSLLLVRLHVTWFFHFGAVTHGNIYITSHMFKVNL
jgi:hypothetical protein